MVTRGKHASGAGPRCNISGPLPRLVNNFCNVFASTRLVCLHGNVHFLLAHFEFTDTCLVSG